MKSYHHFTQEDICCLFFCYHWDLVRVKLQKYKINTELLSDALLNDVPELHLTQKFLMKTIWKTEKDVFDNYV